MADNNNNNNNQEQDDFKLSFKPTLNASLNNNTNNNNHNMNLNHNLNHNQSQNHNYNQNKAWTSMVSPHTPNINTPNMTGIRNVHNVQNRMQSPFLMSFANESGYNMHNNTNHSNINNANNNNHSNLHTTMHSNISIHNVHNNASSASCDVYPEDNGEVIFNEQVPMIVRRSSLESRTRALTLLICKVPKEILSITLTDEQDPYFLYEFRVSDTDFHQLASDQTLLVDFLVFPKSLVMLLQHCLRSRNEQHPKFVCVLSMHENSAHLSVQETNEFRHLQHISLELKLASNSVLRQYLGQTLLRKKKSLATLSTSFAELSESYSRAKLDSSKAEEYVSKMKLSTEQCLCDLKTSHAQQLSEVEQNHSREKEEVRVALLNSHAAKEKEYQLQIKELDLKYAKLKNSFSDLNNDKLQTDSEYKLCAQQLSEFRTLNAEQVSELQSLKIVNKKLDSLKFENEKEICSLKIKISALGQEIIDKKEITVNNNSLLKSLREQKKSISDSFSMYKLNFEKSEKKVRECIKEINKGNNIISHLQNELRNQRNRVKLKESKIQSISQENGNSKKEESRLTNELKQKDFDIAKLKSEIQELKAAVIACKDKLQESHGAIASNKRVITYLNKQLNSNQIGSNMFSNFSSSNVSPFKPQSMSNSNMNANIHSSIPSNIHGSIPSNIHSSIPLNNNNNKIHNVHQKSSYFPQ